MLFTDLLEEQKFCGYIVDDKVRCRAVANLLGIKIALDFFKKSGLPATSDFAVHKIKVLLEELDIADIYIGDIRLDVRLSLSKEEFLIPKKHFENNITPDLYMLVYYDKSIGEAKLTGFISPENVDKSLQDEYYYVVSKSEITPFEKTDELFDTLKAKAKTTLPLNAKKRIALFVDNQLVDKKEFYAEVINSLKARQLLTQFVEAEDVLKATSFEFALKTTIQVLDELPVKTILPLDIEDSKEELEIEPVAQDSIEEFDLGFADGLSQKEQQSEPVEEESSVIEFVEESEESSDVVQEVLEEVDAIEADSLELIEDENFDDNDEIVETSELAQEINEIPSLELNDVVEEIEIDEDVVPSYELSDEEEVETITEFMAASETPVEKMDLDSNVLVEEEQAQDNIFDEEELLDLVDDEDAEEVPNVVESTIEESDDIAVASEEVVELDETTALEEISEEAVELVEAPALEEISEEVVELDEAPALEEISEEVVELDEAPALEEISEEVVELDEAPALEEISEEVVELDEAPALEEISEEVVELDEAPIEELEEEVLEMELDVSDETLGLDVVEDTLEEFDIEVEPIELGVEKNLTFNEFADGMEEVASQEESSLINGNENSQESDMDRFDNLDEDFVPDFAAGELKLEASDSEIEEESEELIPIDDSDELELSGESELEPENQELGIDLQATMEGFVNTLEPEPVVNAPINKVKNEVLEANDDSVLEEISEQVVEEPVEENEVTQVISAAPNKKEVEKNAGITELYESTESNIAEQVPVEDVAPAYVYNQRKKKSGGNGAAFILLVLLALAGGFGYMYKDTILEKFFGGNSASSESVPNELATMPEEPAMVQEKKVPKKKKEVKKETNEITTQEILSGIEEPVQLMNSSVSVSNLSAECKVPSHMINSHSKRYFLKLSKRVQLQLRNALLLLGEQPIANKIEVDLSINNETVKFEKISSSSGSDNIDRKTQEVVQNILKTTTPYAGTFGQNSGVVKLIVKF